MDKTQRILTKTHLAVSLVPWGAFAYLTLYGFALSRALGHWPVFCEKPPVNFPQFIVVIGSVLLTALFFSIPVWFCLLFARLLAKGTVWRPALVFALGWFVCFSVCAVYPARTIYWLLD